MSHFRSGGTSNVAEIEAPVSIRAYLICAFASFGGILFGYDCGYINGVLGMAFVKRQFGRAVPSDIDETGFAISSSNRSLIVSILSAGTFIGALLGGEVAERIGRRPPSCFPV